MNIADFYKSALVAVLIIVGAVFTLSGTANAEGPVDICFVQIKKLANPGGDTEFEFTVTSGEDMGGFTLSSPDNPTEIVAFPGDEVLTVTEQVPEGWELNRIRCEGDEGMVITDIENGRRFECTVPESQATCVFENLNPNLVAVPALSNWGIIAAVAVLALASLYFIRRKSAVKTV